LKLSARGSVDQDDLVRFELVLPGFFHDVCFPSCPATIVVIPRYTIQEQLVDYGEHPKIP
jgi:hypothetical protein